MLKQKNSKKQGDVGLGIAIGWFAAQGHTVCVPLTDSQEYDLVIDDGTLKKVQVRTSRHQRNGGSYQVEMRTKGGNKTGETVKLFDPTKVDLVFVVTDDGKKFLLPSRECPKQSVTLRAGSEYEVT
jgi:hypothetical protein